MKQITAVNYVDMRIRLELAEQNDVVTGSSNLPFCQIHQAI